ncbi:retropepsin-like aspartic protease family protein [Roseateles paludis]|uniref:Retropepsin-like aspartic protease n=1 Tax=Roseateles paludis TaxID=3145238 RepID=A0ABV0G3U5_9BURK
MKPLVLLAALVCCAALAADGPSRVQLNGTLGSRAAVLVIDGSARTVHVGNTVQGVKLLSVDGQQAVVEFNGRREALTLGSAPGHVSGGPAPSQARTIVLPGGSGGHFTTLGSINGQTTQFLVDTGATNVSLSQVEADRLGLRYAYGRRIVTQTANGLVPAHLMLLSSLRVGDVEVRDVEAIIVPAAMSHVLLGNSFLNRFQMKRENDVMTLELRY